MNPPGAKRKRPEASSSSSSGGLDLLDSIMGGMSRTMDRIPVRKPGSASAAAVEDHLEVASHYQMVRPSQHGVPEDKNVCRNPECGGRVFNVDMRQGDKICVNCGCVQNTRSVESYEEEKRTFADDDGKESKSRTSKAGGSPNSSACVARSRARSCS